MLYRFLNAVRRLGSADARFLGRTKNEFKRDWSLRISKELRGTFFRKILNNALTHEFSSSYNHLKVIVDEST
jgi:hypothetical protein